MGKPRQRRPKAPPVSHSDLFVHEQEYRQRTPVASLSEYPGNPYEGGEGYIADSIAENGFFGALLVQKATGYILAGNKTWRAAKEQGLAHVPTLTIDVDGEMAERIVIAANETAKHAVRKEGAFEALVRGLKNPRGVGLTKPHLDRLLKGLKPAAALLQSGGGGKDESAGEGNSGKAQEGRPAGEAKFPLAIVLTGPERKTWEAIKKRLGKTKDKDALLALMAMATATREDE